MGLLIAAKFCLETLLLNTTAPCTAIAPAITAQKVCKSVSTEAGSLCILNSIDLEINQGSSAAIVGVSGSGKSTLLSLLAGLDTPTSGEIYLHQHCISALTEDQRAEVRSEHVGFVFQSFQLLPSLSALENVMLPLELKNHPNAKQMANELLQRVNLGHRLNHYPNQLSGGEQQRVALARAFVNQPKVLFADEPTGNLDSSSSKTIESLLFELNRENNTTLIIVTHDLELANLCKTKICLTAGEISSAENG